MAVPMFPDVVVDLPDDAHTGMVRSRVHKALGASGDPGKADEYLEATNHVSEDIESLLVATSGWVIVRGGPAIESLIGSVPEMADETHPAGRVATNVVWEYKVVKDITANKLEESLNRLGADGWELVAMAGLDGVVSITGNKLYAVMKRQSRKGRSSLT